MVQQQQLSVEEMDNEWLDDPFLQDANLDTSCISPDLREKYYAKTGIKDPNKRKPDPFDSVSDPFQARDTHKANYDAMLRDPEILRDLAERDPNELTKWQDSVGEQVVAEFLRKTPHYMRTDSNRDAITRFLAKKFLDKDWLDSEDAIRELVSHGSFTVENLGEAYRELLRRGKLDVPRGHFKQLNRREQLETIAIARQQGLPAGALHYLRIAVGDSLPDDDAGIARWRAENANVWNFCMMFVWFNSRPGISSENFDVFRQRVLSRYPMLDFDLIEKCWADFNRGVPVTHNLEAIAEQAEQAINPDDLSDAELAERIRETREKLRQQRGW